MDEVNKKLQQVISNLEGYTGDRPNTSNVLISVLTLRRYINKLQEIIGLISEKLNDDKDCSKCSRRSWYQKGYADAEKKLANNSMWILCKDKMPPSGDEVLVYVDGYDEISIAWYNDEDNLWYSNDFSKDMSGDIVAWQKLPANPNLGKVSNSKSCSTCENNTDFDEVDNGCYMCSKGLEDNYSEKGE